MSCRSVVNQHYNSPLHRESLTTKSKSSLTNNAHHPHHHLANRQSPNGSLSFESPSSQQACDPSELFGAILQRDEMRDDRLCHDHSLAIRSVNEGSTFPLVLVIHCVVEMIANAMTVTTESLLDACEELEKRLTPNLMNLLKEMDIPDRLRFALRDSGGSSHRGPSSSSNHGGRPEERSRQRVGGLENSHISGGGGDEIDTPSQTKRLGTDSRQANVGTTQMTKQTAFSSLPGNDTESRNMRKEWLRNECLVAITNEHYMLEKLKICMHCCVNPRGVTFLPCGHFTTCRDCAGTTSVCDLCNKRILATVDTFLS
ncbi:unnamed protein product [Lymnaea stagnalis]|uniref:RING-type domain-containing protein n=1 Tax=Lymnaea stagnalis TaxID=6523 RepID=A0AAV2HPL1_LYMST